MYSTRVLAFLALFVELAYSFSWGENHCIAATAGQSEAHLTYSHPSTSTSLPFTSTSDIVVGEEKRLQFYHKGKLTHTEEIPLAQLITSVTYDPVHYGVLFVDENRKKWNMTIYSFDISTRKIQPLFTKQLEEYYPGVFYDPVTQLLFWKNRLNIYLRPLKPGSFDDAVDGNLFLTLEFEHYVRAIAVDSCGGYIYWITDYEIERARFDGSEREILIQGKVYERGSIAIDHQTQKIYWIETIEKNHSYHQYTECADLDGSNRRTLYTVENDLFANSLAVSEDFIYWRGSNENMIWRLPKNPQNNEGPKHFKIFNRYCPYCQLVAANYSIQEQTQGIPNCEALKSLTQNNSKTELTGVSLLCVHGTEVSGESRCECAHGFTGERCDVSLCYNYCLQGDCNVSPEGPECRCKTDYSGKRCEVNECYMYCLNNGVCSSDGRYGPVCKCTPEYKGERCEVSICKDYCLQGNCKIDSRGRPKCSCNSGHSGRRCEVNPCAEYCLNDGVCSLNDEHQPVCRCTAGYEGARCDVSVCKDLSFQAACSVSAEGQPKVTVTLGRAVESTCAVTVV